MKYIISFIVFLLVSISSFNFIGNTFAANSIFNNTTTQIPYCKSGEKCGIKDGIDQVKKINDLSKEENATTFVTNVVKYIIGFTYLIAVILIIYAGFNLLTGIGDEEKAKKSKTMILYVIIGIALIFLAGPIVNFIMKMLS